MTTPKFASLHGGLLARKGEASPAIPPSMARASYTDAAPQPQHPLREAAPHLHAAPPPHTSVPATPANGAEGPRKNRFISEVKSAPSRAKPATKFQPLAGKPKTEAKAASATGNCGADCASRSKDSNKKYRISLRLNAEQRRRLRTAAAQLEVSNQQLVAKALDAYLDQLGLGDLNGCACLARRAAGQGNAKA